MCVEYLGFAISARKRRKPSETSLRRVYGEVRDGKKVNNPNWSPPQHFFPKPGVLVYLSDGSSVGSARPESNEIVRNGGRARRWQRRWSSVSLEG
ncbi:hypothetical protein MHYP_G00225370 [Metynnis hypsauchen]